MNIAIVGSRTFTDYELMRFTVNEYISTNNIQISQIVSGGAKGADTLAEKFAEEHQLEMVVFRPDWKKYGNRAGFMRNTSIIENSDIVFAFWDGKSTGTKDSMDKAEMLGKTLIVVVE